MKTYFVPIQRMQIGNESNAMLLIIELSVHFLKPTKPILNFSCGKSVRLQLRLHTTSVERNTVQLTNQSPLTLNVPTLRELDHTIKCSLNLITNMAQKIVYTSEFNRVFFQDQ